MSRWPCNVDLQSIASASTDTSVGLSSAFSAGDTFAAYHPGSEGQPVQLAECTALERNSSCLPSLETEPLLCSQAFQASTYGIPLKSHWYKPHAVPVPCSMEHLQDVCGSMHARSQDPCQQLLKGADRTQPPALQQLPATSARQLHPRAHAVDMQLPLFPHTGQGGTTEMAALSTAAAAPSLEHALRSSALPSGPTPPIALASQYTSLADSMAAVNVAAHAQASLAATLAALQLQRDLVNYQLSMTPYVSPQPMCYHCGSAAHNWSKCTQLSLLPELVRLQYIEQYKRITDAEKRLDKDRRRLARNKMLYRM